MRRLGARRLVLLVLTPILLFYCYVILAIAWSLFTDGRFAARGTALALVVLVAVTVGLVVAEVQFGRRAEGLAKEYDASLGAAPADGDGVERLPLAPSGRPDRDAADAAFDRVSERVKQAPDDWRAWYELALAYGDARDTTRGRRAMRRAIELRAGQR